MKDRIERQRKTSPRARTSDGRPTHAQVSPDSIQTILDRLRSATRYEYFPFLQLSPANSLLHLSLLSTSQQEELARVNQSASEPAGTDFYRTYLQNCVMILFLGFTPDIEEEANKKFQLIYSGAMTIEDAVLMLKTYKSATNPREQKVRRFGLLAFFIF